MFEEQASTGKVKGDVLGEIRRRVNADKPTGFFWFYLLVKNMPIPRHGKKWTRKLYKARDANGVARFINEAFRGSTKTTIFTELFTAYQIGLYPERSNLFVQASDITAEEAASNVADIIEFNPGFKLLFPNIVKDQPKGWGQNGRWVKRTDIPYDDWVRIRHKNPTLIGATYKASVVVGKHPTGVFVMDDINDRKNTESDRLNKEVNETVTDTLFPCLEATVWNIFNQTPWTKRDALELVKNTGAWTSIKTPVLIPAPEGIGEHVVVEKNGVVIYEQWAELTWPEKFNKELIALKYKETGEKGFARMYLLDLTAIEGLHLRREWLHDFPREDLRGTYPIFMGVDYASSADLVKSDPDNTAMAAVAKLHNGDRIILDGWFGQVSQAEAEIKLNQWAGSYDRLELVGIETDGTGREFYSLMARNTKLPLIEMGTGGRSKGYRFEEIMAPYFEMGRVWLSHPYSPFTRKFIDEWVSWSGEKNDECDTLDAVFYALAASGLFLEEAWAAADTIRDKPWYEKEEASVSPFGSFGRQARGR
jgi:hypothetical protein